MIYKIDYSKGLKNREKLPSHAVIDPFYKKRCFAFYVGRVGETDTSKLQPLNVSFKPIDDAFLMSKTNYMIKYNY